MTKKALLIGGEFTRLLARKKHDQFVEIGELLVAEDNYSHSRHLLQVFSLSYGSQLSDQNRELISGMALEEDESVQMLDQNIRNYVMLHLKNLIKIDGKKATLSKSMPNFFSDLRDVTKEDLRFLNQDKGLFLGQLRSGSKTIEVPIFLDAKKCLSHHILVPATTGRGKSNLTSTLLFSLVDSDDTAFLVLDPHDEYFGRNQLGLKDHPSKDKIMYYTLRDVPAGQKTLKIHLHELKPSHFQGVLQWSDPQRDMMTAYFREKKQRWIESIILEEPIQISQSINDATKNVVKRRLMNLLDISVSENQLICNGIFDNNAGKTTISDIIKSLEDAKTIIIDTSSFSGAIELLVGSLITNHVFFRYKQYKKEGSIEEKPVISVVLEEAPRVLGKDVLEKGHNIFSTIAREGRKFKIGLYAITQLPSLIPREILANMNTKIILGIEMQPERESIINSAAHDLSDYSKAIASLDKGEAIITSNFSIFPIPVKIPLFSDVVRQYQNESVKEQSERKYKQEFDGIKF